MKKLTFLSALLVLWVMAPAFGQISFSAKKIIDTAALNGYGEYYFTDLDQDGDPDFLYPSYEEGVFKLTWLEQNNNHEFVTKHVVLQHQHITSLSPADLDGDGDTDILAMQQGPTAQLLWLENLGNGQFSTGHFISAGSYNGSAVLDRIRAVDFDGDGDQDAVFTFLNGQKSNIQWIKNDGAGHFSAVEMLWQPSSPVVNFDCTDFNADGKLDIFFTSRELQNAALTKLSWIKNTGNNHFASENTIADSVRTDFVLALDMNHDQLPDVVTLTNTGYGQILWFKNKGATGFDTDAMFIGMAFYGTITANDVDDDGNMDLVGWYRTVVKSEYHFYFNGSNGVSSTPSIISSNLRVGEILDNLTVEDWDLDGNSDLLCLTKNCISSHKNLGNHQFGLRRLISDDGPYGIMGVQVGDITGDGKPDIVKVNGQVAGWYENDGNLGFGDKKLLSSDSSFSTFYLLDVNKDNHLDVVKTTATELVWFEISASGQLLNKHTILSFGYVNGVNFNDLDGDGDPDMVFIKKETGSTETNLLVYRNDGTGGFEFIQTVNLGSGSITGLAIAKIDGDNAPDLLFYSDADGLVWLTNDGLGYFGTSTVIANFPSSYQIDLDGDGDIDLFHKAIVGGSYWFEALLNNGDGHFGAAQTVDYDPNLNLGFSDILAMADFDHDGDSDILISSLDGTGFMENKGNLTFGPFQFMDDDYWSVSSADLDGDGDLDLAGMSATVPQKIAWFENRTGASATQTPSELLNIQICPNPAVNQAVLSFDTPNSDRVYLLEIKDLQGKTMGAYTGVGTSINLQRDHLPAGMYLVQIKDIKTGKIVGMQPIVWQ